MAEDDDDDSFGDFIASHQTTVNSSSQISSTTDDDWGDFSFVQNNTTNHNANSPQPQWEKIRGALPLSLFGEDEEDEEEDRDEKPVVKQLDVAGNGRSGSNNNINDKNVDSSARIGINDLIANLYGQRPPQQIVKADGDVNHGNGLDFNGVNSTVAKVSLSKSDAFRSSNLNTVGDQESDDEGGWEFRDAYSGSNNAHTGNDNKECSKGNVPPLGLQDGSHGPFDLFAAPNNGFFIESHAMDSGFNTKPITASQNGFTMDFKTDHKSTVNGNSNPLGGSDDTNDNFGVFETAFPEKTLKQKESSREDFLSEFDTGFNIKPNTSIQNGFDTEFNFQTEWKDVGSGSNTHPFAGNVDSGQKNGEFDAGHQKTFSEENISSLGSRDNSQGPVDLFALSNGVPAESHKREYGFDFGQASVIQNGFTSDPYSHTEQDKKGSSDSQPLGASVDSDESFGGFETSFPEPGSKLEGYEESQKKYKEPVPLSIFGIEEPEADNSLNLQNEFSFKSSTQVKKKRNHSSNLSIDDLSDLYSQAEPIHPVYYEHSPAGKDNVLQSTEHDHNSLIVGDDNFDDGSWKFKVAFTQSRVENQNFPFDQKLKNCTDLYSKIKDELNVVARDHLHRLKKAKNDAALAGEETKVAIINKEIQLLEEAVEELHQENTVSTESQLDDHSERVICFKQYIETLHEPNFQALDSEYDISRRLSLAESDLREAIDLIKHFSTTLKILTLVPKNEPANYVFVWRKMISVCAQELKHGTWIWKQSLEKNVQSQILSETQGRQFVIALGEIYRAAVIFGACVKIYKPWILLSSEDLAEIHTLLEECHSLWSTPGLKAAIPVKSLLESIKRIQDLDSVSVANESHETPLCRLSLLSQEVVPEMKMVVWNGDRYFVTLANLWANLISPDPPKLTSTQVN